MKFSDLIFKETYKCIQCKIEFPNGYGASIVRGTYSYGGTEGLYEIGVLNNGELDYSTHITDDVIGWLDEDDILEIVSVIEALPKK